jgi:3-deoxy-7-phosphoheptulonate synthase
MKQMREEVEFLSQFKDDCELVIRGGAFKGQLSPERKMVDGEWINTEKEYLGLEMEGLRILGVMENTFGINCCTELMCPEHVDIACKAVYWAQVGTRHMGNLPLLRALRSWSGPILLKRGMGNTIHEWISAAEHLLSSQGLTGKPGAILASRYDSNIEGNFDNANTVVLCERGIVTHEHTDPRIRWRPDLLAIPQIKTDYPQYKIILDCSHSTGRRDLVLPMAKAAMACGADGVMIECIKVPAESMTDAAQAVDHEMFKRIMEAIL